MMQIYPDGEALARGAAELFIAQAQQGIRAAGRFSAALSGGSTPKRAYELLGQPPYRDQVPWDRVHLFWGDERCVPPTDPRSNYRMTKLALLDHVPLPPAQVHRIAGEKPPAEAAAAYEAVLRAFFHDGPPRFDLVFLGLGENAHTASLFPGNPVLEETTRWAAEVFVAEVDMWRVTLTAPTLNAGAVLAFLVAGASKAAVVQEVRSGPYDPQRKPAQLIKPSQGQLLWLLDRAAAAAVKAS